ncbi:MAG: hypothetical protein MAG458_01413 [Nitrosopumilus sp.]|nr:hypothetical protein [Nitrosopumilus sp.]
MLKTGLFLGVLGDVMISRDKFVSDFADGYIK